MLKPSGVFTADLYSWCAAANFIVCAQRQNGHGYTKRIGGTLAFPITLFYSHKRRTPHLRARCRVARKPVHKIHSQHNLQTSKPFCAAKERKLSRQSDIHITSYATSQTQSDLELVTYQLYSIALSGKQLNTVTT